MDRNTISQFFESLFGDKPDEEAILLWTLPDKKSSWCMSVDEAVQKTAELAETQSVYFGTGLRSGEFVESINYSKTQRGKVADVSGITTLWLDVDVISPSHKDSKKKLPPTKDAAMELVKASPLQPTMIIDTGGGLQAFWKFQEPWVFENAEDRTLAAEISRRWVMLFQNYAAASGWDVDAVQDLTRVMRVGGSFNRKPELTEPYPVAILENNEHAVYDYQDFDDYAVILQKSEKPILSAQSGDSGWDFTLDANAQPPIERFQALFTNDVKFKQSWERQRGKRDLPDQSASSYDLSLAAIAAQAGWTDQEIVNLLISSRRNHLDDLKLRRDYYGRTIAMSRKSTKLQEAKEALETMDLQPDILEGATDEDVEVYRDTILESLSTMFGIKVVQMIKYVADEPLYRIVTEKGSIKLGEIGSLTSQAMFRKRIAAATSILIPSCGKADWDQRAQALLNACEEVEIGPEATEAGAAERWLTGYCASNRPADDFTKAIGSRSPFIKDDHVHIFLDELRIWIGRSVGDKITPRTLGTYLKQCGCEPYRIAKDGTTTNTWRIPKNIAKSSQR